MQNSDDVHFSKRHQSLQRKTLLNLYSLKGLLEIGYYVVDMLGSYRQTNRARGDSGA